VLVPRSPSPVPAVPPAQGGTALLHSLLSQIVEVGGSDLHLREGEPPFARYNGRLQPLPGNAVLTPASMRGLMEAVTRHVPKRFAEFEADGEADLSYELEGVARYRVNIFRERGRLAQTLRVIPQKVPHIDEVGVPPIIRELALEHHGLILVTGATGSGKTTTLAAMIDHMNRNTERHILTIEDPIEIMHTNHKSLVSQREVGTDTGDFKQALRRALRQDPDVILIGEIRDEETMRTALAAAETGHLVLATLHTINAQETIARVLDLFPSEAEKQARAMIAGALKGIISQRLCRTVEGGRTPVVEVCVNTARIANCIANPDETAKLTEAITEGQYYGMQTFDQALIALITAGTITEAEALAHVSSPQNFRLVLDSTLAQRAVDQEREAREQAQRAAAEEAERYAAAYAAQQQQGYAAPPNAAPPGGPGPVQHGHTEPYAQPAAPGGQAQPAPLAYPTEFPPPAAPGYASAAPPAPAAPAPHALPAPPPMPPPPGA